ncbi:hypothetical protein [Rhodohalobacter sp. 614A]|uniref:hypothetical protein n=1 Tax=Rhodohalobacter sp. 614A TaxID=2908649 RepID=UPI001F38D036|nr:hypothetical protein [Rhodohalobacter sp. 614A]
MSTNSEQERERLKEEYKDHYRKIRDAKEKLRRSKYVQNVNEALHQMNADELLASVDEFLGKVRTKMSLIEARLDVAMEQVLDQPDDISELDEELKKEKARESLKKIKAEMGLLYREIEKQAAELHAEKTIGPGNRHSSSDSPKTETDSDLA